MAKKTSKIYIAISNAVSSGKLAKTFNVKDVNSACNGLLLKSPSFLSKHRLGNPGGYYVYFEWVREGVYKIV